MKTNNLIHYCFDNYDQINGSLKHFKLYPVVYCINFIAIHGIGKARKLIYLLMFFSI